MSKCNELLEEKTLLVSTKIAGTYNDTVLGIFTKLLDFTQVPQEGNASGLELTDDYLPV